MQKTIIDECRLRNYSQKTIKAYLHYNKEFLKWCKKRPQQVRREDIRQYLLYLSFRHKSSSSINLAHNALNFYYKNILKRGFVKIPFQKREEKQKNVLSKEEIGKLINSMKNSKHKLMISLLYASGVRVDELIRIKIIDIIFEEKLLKVRQGKGKKDRTTILSERVVWDIKRYIKERKFGSDYLFETRKGHVTTRTVQEVLKRAKRNAGIKSFVSPHILRHSFGTHLAASNVNEASLQKLLGHKDPKTTKQYVHLANKDIKNIKSPHDDLR